MALKTIIGRLDDWLKANPMRPLCRTQFNRVDDPSA